MGHNGINNNRNIEQEVVKEETLCKLFSTNILVIRNILWFLWFHVYTLRKVISTNYCTFIC